MADKEATVFVVDLGQSMSEIRHGRTHSDLDWSLRWIEDKLTNIVYAGRKTLVVGILGLGTDHTANEMQDEEGYDHISELQPIQPMILNDLRELSSKLVPSRTNQRDAMSAIILAVDMLMRFCGKLKWKKKIILVTNGTGHMNPDAEDISSTAEQIKAKEIDLLMLGTDFDDAEYGFKEEDKPSNKGTNEELFKQLADKSGGRVGTMAEAIEGLAIPYIKPIRPTPTFKGKLCLGDPSTYDTAITIDIERYFKVALKRPPAASSFAVRPEGSDQKALQTIESGRGYQVSDPEKPGGFKDVAREELAKGYEYGRTAVHIAESDENITKLETTSAYDILGFIPKENVERYLLLDNTNMLVASKGNVKATLALSSLVRALYEMDSVAVARLIKKDMSEPQLTLLTPLIDENVECLVENILPFAEDMRQYRFSSVDKIVTVSGRHLSTHRNLPSEKLMDAMSNFVDGLVLEDTAVTIEETFSPVNYAIESAIKYRAVHTGKEIPSLPESFLAVSNQPPYLRDKAALARLIEVADVKGVPPKSKGRKRYREVERPLSGLNVDDLFKKNSTRISPENAIPEFKQALARADMPDQIQDAVNQMTVIIKDRIKLSFGDDYDRVVEELGGVRQELQDYEFPQMYNEFIRALKSDILNGRLGGNRRVLWYRIKISKLGLIDETQCDASNITNTEASDFYSG